VVESDRVVEKGVDSGRLVGQVLHEAVQTPHEVADYRMELSKFTYRPREANLSVCPLTKLTFLLIDCQF
jgi:hypothetical protein